MRLYPAIDIAGGDADLIAGFLDDFAPSAIEERDGTVRAFFATSAQRDSACGALVDRFRVESVDVSDEDWARRSQENLQPVTVGRVTIVHQPPATDHQPPATDHQPPATDLQPPTTDNQPLRIVIQPSMGFGTGHHATTRLCLEAVQQVDLRGKRVLDVGTGSGVLAIAAARLGASEAVGIDVDPDAIQSARENLALNAEAVAVRFDIADLASAPLPRADIVLANLTGALLVRTARTLWAVSEPDGVLIVSGLQSHERGEVVAALAPKKILWQGEDDSWVGLMMTK